MLAGQSDGAVFPSEGSSSQMTIVCVMLTKTNQCRPQRWLLGWSGFLLPQAVWDAFWPLWSMVFLIHLAFVSPLSPGSFWTLLSGQHGQFLTAWKRSFWFSLVPIKLRSSKQSNNKSHTIENVSTGLIQMTQRNGRQGKSLLQSKAWPLCAVFLPPRLMLLAFLSWVTQHNRPGEQVPWWPFYRD